MRRRILLVLLLPACGNVTHPEYHPVTSVQYTQTVSYGASAGGQPAANAPPPWLAPPQPIAIPSPPPPDMGW
jgi:hypothetical protein